MSRFTSRLACFLLLSYLISPAMGQESPVTLTLKNAIDIALKDSYDAKNLALQLLEAEQNVSAARGRFRTNADLSLQAPNFTEQVSAINVPNQPTAYNTTGSMQWRADLNIQQPLPTNGSVSLQSNIRQRRDSVFLESLDTTNNTKRFFTNVRFTLVQPLFVPNTLKLGLERANLQLELAERSFTRTVSTGNVFRCPGGTQTSRYLGSAAIPSTGPVLPQNSPQITLTFVPSSSAISGISGEATS